MRRVARPAGLGAWMALTAFLAGCGTTITGPDLVTFEVIGVTPFASSLGIDLGTYTKLETGVYIRDLAVGDGAVAAVGTRPSLEYTGWLANGTEFDAGTFTFAIGAGEVIPGFEQGMVGMKVGGTRRIIIPPELGYGPRGSGPVPGGAIVIFEVVLKEVV